MPSLALEQYPVSAWQEGGDSEWHSTGIAYEDYARCHIETHKKAPSRKLPTPEWAISDSQFREVLINHLEARAGIRPWRRVGTYQERLARAQQRIAALNAMLLPVLDRLCAEYVARKRRAQTTQDRVWLRKREIEIESVDTRLRIEAKDGGAALIAGVVYHYYRLGSDSVGVGEALGIKPPHVRNILWRLHQTAKQLEKWRRDPSSRPVTHSCLRQPRRFGKRPIDEEKAVALYQSGIPLAEIACQLGYPRGGGGRERVRRVLVKAGIFPSAKTA